MKYDEIRTGVKATNTIDNIATYNDYASTKCIRTITSHCYAIVAYNRYAVKIILMRITTK